MASLVPPHVEEVREEGRVGHVRRQAVRMDSARAARRVPP